MKKLFGCQKIMTFWFSTCRSLDEKQFTRNFELFFFVSFCFTKKLMFISFELEKKIGCSWGFSYSSWINLLRHCRNGKFRHNFFFVKTKWNSILISQGRSPQICRLCVSLQNQKFALRDKTSFNCFVIDNLGLMAKKHSLIKTFDS